jgi:hypothetical protein
VTPRGPVPTAPRIDAPPILTTATGVTVLPGAGSTAKAEFKGYEGVMSKDDCLGNPTEILNFLQTHNTRPRQFVRVHGYHREQRTRRVTERDSEGRERERIEHYYVTVDDFDYKIDLTQFIFPYGLIQCRDGTSIPDVIERYLDDGSAFRRLSMEKVVLFDFSAMERLVYGYVRSLGWHRGLNVSFPRANYKVWIRNSNCALECYENPCGKCLCYASCIGCCIMKCINKRHTQKGISSVYEVRYHPTEVCALAIFSHF